MTTPDDKTPDPRRLEVEVEVPGTPEQVWEAIATGPGISAWFMPTEVDEHEGGTVKMDHGPAMESSAVVSAWERPRRFAYEEEFQPTEDAAPERIATEFLVEASSGDTCVVRVVMSGFGSGADWDRAMESFEPGWRQALESLRLYLTHFPGRRCASIAAMGSTSGSVDRVWPALTGALGLSGATAGDRAATSGPGVPTLAGRVERADEGMITLLLDEPAPGLGLIGAGGPGEEVFTVVRAQLFGEAAPAVAARDEPAWRAWMDEHFPSG
jgi:uncharacterized protein YndB with AHSA1/START domain